MRVVSTGGGNAIWYKSAFQGGVYGRRETVWAFYDAEQRPVVPLEGGTVAARIGRAVGKSHSSIRGVLSACNHIVGTMRLINKVG